MGRYGCEGQTSLFDLLPTDAIDTQDYLYILTDETKYELPVYVCDSIEELADYTGDSVGYINDCIKKAIERNGSCKYVKVRIDE